MNDGDVLVREVSWRDVLPWTIIYKAFGVSISMPVLTLAAIGLLLTPLGWKISQEAFLTTSDQQTAGKYQLDNWEKAYKRWSEASRTVSTKPLSERVRQRILSPSSYTESTLWNLHVEPFAQLFRMKLKTDPYPMRVFTYLLVGNLWTLLVWSLFGGAITRIAVVQLGRNERVGMTDALGFSLKKLGSFFLSPIVPIFAVAILCIPAVVMGWIMRLDWGVAVIGILWIFVLIGGLLLTILLVGLFFGWPLMWGAISSEIQGDVFEATSRSYSYTYQRPLHYLFYAMIAIVVGVLGGTLVQLFAESVLYLSQWGLAWGAGVDRMASVVNNESGLLAGGAKTGYYIIGFFNSIVRVAAESFYYSFFWCGAAAIYLLLRRNVDHTEFDEIFVEDEVDRFGIPPLEADEHGVPVIADEQQPGEDASEPPVDEKDDKKESDTDTETD